jgi:hypothetical protein
MKVRSQGSSRYGDCTLSASPFQSATWNGSVDESVTTCRRILSLHIVRGLMKASARHTSVLLSSLALSHTNGMPSPSEPTTPTISSVESSDISFEDVAAIASAGDDAISPGAHNQDHDTPASPAVTEHPTLFIREDMVKIQVCLNS